MMHFGNGDMENSQSPVWWLYFATPSSDYRPCSQLFVYCRVDQKDGLLWALIT